jgi:hypothetical protein
MAPSSTPGSFDNYDLAFDVTRFAVFLSLIAWLTWTPRSAEEPHVRYTGDCTLCPDTGSQ